MIIWRKYIWERRTINQLANDYNKSERWIRNQLDEIRVRHKLINPQPIVANADCVFFGRTNGYVVFRSFHLKKNLYWKKIANESARVYRLGRMKLEAQGFLLKAVVIDGKHGTKRVFSDIPIQMCHFHQVQIVLRYLTKRPKLLAAQELNKLVLLLSETDKTSFTFWLTEWHKKWNHVLKEKVTNSKTDKYYFIHRKLRSAYRSLKTNLPYLFSHQDYPELNIPNTNNSLEGSFTNLKELVRIHRGSRRARKDKIIDEILGK